MSLTGAQVSIAPAFHTVADVPAGGSLLWVVGELTTLVAMGITVYQWMRAEERQAARLDRQLDAQLDASGTTPVA